MRGTVWGGTGIAAVAVLLLAGCGGAAPGAGPAVDPTVEPAPSSPSPTESADPPAEVDAIVVLPTGIELRAGGEVVETLGYLSPAEDAIATLTEAIGAAPTAEPYEGDFHFPAGVLHTWDGLVVNERSYDEAERAAQGYDWELQPNFSVFLDADAVGDIALSSGSGTAVGDPADEVGEGLDLGDGEYVCEGTPVEAADVQTDAGPRQVTVAAQLTEDGAAVGRIVAPAVVADACV